MARRALGFARAPDAQLGEPAATRRRAGAAGRVHVARRVRRDPRPLRPLVRGAAARTDDRDRGRARGGRFHVGTARGGWRARNVVLATGDGAAPAVPSFAPSAPEEIEQLHASRYRAPERLAPGGVLVVGSGPSGHQIADELARAGRRVVFAAGRHERIVRRYRGRDIWAWLDALGDLSRSRPADELSSRARHPRPALPLDGRRGGRTLDLGVLAAAGVRITARLEGFAGTHALLGGALDANVADADARLRHLLRRIDDHIASRPDADAFPPPERIAPLRVPAPPRAIDLAREGIATIVWATGHRRHFRICGSPRSMTDDGDVSHDRGRTAVPGLYVLGHALAVADDVALDRRRRPRCRGPRRRDRRGRRRVASRGVSRRYGGRATAATSSPPARARRRGRRGGRGPPVRPRRRPRAAPRGRSPRVRAAPAGRSAAATRRPHPARGRA